MTKEDISETQTEEVHELTDSGSGSSNNYCCAEKLDNNANTTYCLISLPKTSELLSIESASSIWSEDDIGTLCLPSHIQ